MDPKPGGRIWNHWNIWYFGCILRCAITGKGSRRMITVCFTRVNRGIRVWFKYTNISNYLCDIVVEKKYVTWLDDSRSDARLCLLMDELKALPQNSRQYLLAVPMKELALVGLRQHPFCLWQGIGKKMNLTCKSSYLFYK